MCRFWRRHEEESPEPSSLDEARQAVIEARSARGQTHSLWGRVNSVADTLARDRYVNDYAGRFDLAYKQQKKRKA